MGVATGVKYRFLKEKKKGTLNLFEVFYLGGTFQVGLSAIAFLVAQSLKKRLPLQSLPRFGL